MRDYFFVVENNWLYPGDIEISIEEGKRTDAQLSLRMLSGATSIENSTRKTISEIAKNIVDGFEGKFSIVCRIWDNIIHYVFGYNTDRVKVWNFYYTIVENIAIENALESYKKNKGKLTVDEKKNALENIFTEIKQKAAKSPKVDFYLASVCHAYAMIDYADNFTTCKQQLLDVLEFQFSKVGLISEKVDLLNHQSLSEWKKTVCSKTSSQISEKTLETINANSMHEALGHWHSNKKKYLLAMTYRWLGACYQNIDTYKKDLETYGGLFKNLYGTTGDILTSLSKQKDDEYYVELTELYYNTNYFLHLIDHPGDEKGARDCFVKILERDNSLRMQARVNNWLAIYEKDPKEKLFYGNKVLELWEKITKEELTNNKELSFDTAFLQVNAKNNFASTVVELQIKDEFDKAEALVKEACEFAEKQNEKKKDHSYFGIYFFTYAKLKLAKGEFKEASKLISNAIERLEKHIESMSEDLRDAKALKTEIEKKLQ